MNIYLYAKSGHSVGLDATRRCAAIAKKLKDYNPILTVSDFRAGAYAKDELGVQKYVPIDILSNLPNIMNKGDILIYDTDEASETMQEHMNMFASLLYKIPQDISYNIVDEELYHKREIKYNELFFYGDDDYSNQLLEDKSLKDCDIPLLMGHYFFLGNEKELEKKFKKLIDEEEYIQSIQESKYLLTGSLQAACESISCGNFPVLLKRKDKEYDDNFIKELNLSTIKEDCLSQNIKEFREICKKNSFEINFNNFQLDPILSQIKDKFDNSAKINH